MKEKKKSVEKRYDLVKTGEIIPSRGTSLGRQNLSWVWRIEKIGSNLTSPMEVCLLKAIVSPVVIYGCES